MKSYVLVGAGGTGSHLLHPLVAYLSTFHGKEDWRLLVVDGDEVETHNLERQLFNPAMVKMNKAKAAVLPFKHLPNVIPVGSYLGAGNIDSIIHDGDTVLICVDNFPVRALIEAFCTTLPNSVVINGGNEESTGTCQIWVRENGGNVTPNLSFQHPEIHKIGDDRAEMTCQQIAQIPGGEQLIITNMMSANFMLMALMKIGRNEIEWTEGYFDVFNPTESYVTDYRDLNGWQ